MVFGLFTPLRVACTFTVPATCDGLTTVHVVIETQLTLVATVVPSPVTEASYGQDVHRRVATAIAVGVLTLGLGALTALSKSKKHSSG